MPVYTYTTIDDPLDTGTMATFGGLAINNSGQIVGNYTDSNGKVHGFLYSNSTYTTLTVPSGGMVPFAVTVPLGINNLGQIVGEYADASNTVHGFLYSDGNYTNLEDPLANVTGSFNGTLAQGINDTDQIVGSYDDASGRHGFLFDTSRGIIPPYFTLNDPSAIQDRRDLFRCERPLARFPPYDHAEPASARWHYCRHDPAARR